MVERRFQAIEDVAVDTGGLTDNLKPGLLAKLSGQVADQARKSARAVGQGPHPAGQNLVVQSGCERFALACKLFNGFNGFAQFLQALRRLPFWLPPVDRDRQREACHPDSRPGLPGSEAIQVNLSASPSAATVSQSSGGNRWV